MKCSSKAQCEAIERRIASYQAIIEMVETARDELSDAKEWHMDRDTALAVSLNLLTKCMEQMQEHINQLHWSITDYVISA